MIRDHLVVGIRNNLLLEQMDAELTLEKPSDKRSCTWATVSFE